MRFLERIGVLKKTLSMALATETLELPLFSASVDNSPRPELAEELIAFREFGAATRELQTKVATGPGETISVRTFVNE